MNTIEIVSMADAFDRVFEFTLSAGPPCVDNFERIHPGESFKGIYRGSSPEWPGWIILDRLRADGLRPPYIDDVRGVLNRLARSYYRKRFWQGVFADLMPDPLAMALFDSAVMHGRNRALRFLQEALNTMLGARVLDEDGIFCRNSREALDSILHRDAWHWTTLVCEMLRIRQAYCDQVPCADRFSDARCRVRLGGLQAMIGMSRGPAGFCGKALGLESPGLLPVVEKASSRFPGN